MTDDGGVLLTCVSGVMKHSLSRSGVHRPETVLLMGCVLENYTLAEIRVWSRAEKSYFTPADATHTHIHSIHLNLDTETKNRRKIYRLHV